MSMRNLAITTGLALVISGCAIGPRHYEQPYYGEQSSGYDDGYYDYHDTPSYDGYYDVRVIFIGSIPYYVDDDRHIRPIPPQYREHFYRQRYMERNRTLQPPMFSRDREVRDGYPMSRIVYMDGIPYYVDNDRGARPLPSRLHDRFRYTPMPQNNGRPEGGRPLPPAYGHEREQNVPPAFGREREQNVPPAYGREPMQNVPPAYGREPMQNVPPAYGREREQNVPPAYGRQPMQNVPPAYGREPMQNVPPAYGRQPEQKAPPTFSREPEQDVPSPNGRERDNSNLPAFMPQRDQAPARFEQHRIQDDSRGQQQGSGAMSRPQLRNDNGSRAPQQNNGATQRGNSGKRDPGHKGEGEGNRDGKDAQDQKRRNGHD